MLRNRFDAAREAAGIPKAEFQFRDLRATAATAVDEAGGIKQAQALLSHTTEGMTARYIRHKEGKKVQPVRRIAHRLAINYETIKKSPVLLQSLSIYR